MDLSILYIGSLFKGSTALHRLNAIKQVYNDVKYIESYMLNIRFLMLIDRLLNKISRYGINSFLLNRNLTKLTSDNPFNFIWIDKGLQIFPITLKSIKNKYPNTKLIHYSPDDMMNPINQSRNYLNSIPFYDLHVTTKSYNVDELYAFGAKKVLFVNNAYAPEIHKPYYLSEEEIRKYSSDVSFIGSPEKERADSINFIAKNGIKVTIWGIGWEKYLKRNQNITIIKGFFADEEYCKIICASKINLAFLRKVNRDLQTTRTMEIPACGGFMLAERTEEHKKLFKEDEEAVYFSNDEELLEKIKYFLREENRRLQIANRGFIRCKKSGYDNISMVKKVFSSFN